MANRILILGASYGSLFGTKCLMAGSDVTLVCRQPTAELINARGTDVRIKLKGEDAHRAIHSAALPGRLVARSPEKVDLAGYDMVVLAMQEPQYLHHSIRTLLARIAAAGVPCLSLMNMPPLSSRHLRRRRIHRAADRRATRRPGGLRQIRGRRRAADQPVVGCALHRCGCADGRARRQTGAADRPPTRD